MSLFFFFYILFLVFATLDNTYLILAFSDATIQPGWFSFARQLGYGWCAAALGSSSLRYGFDPDNTSSVIRRSYIYDSTGNYNQFHFALANGKYRVSVGVGIPSDVNNTVWQYVELEGVVLQHGPVSGLQTYTAQVDLQDSLLTLGAGRSGSGNVTVLSFLTITPLGDAGSVAPPDNGPMAAAAAGCPLTAGNAAPSSLAPTSSTT